MRCVQVHMSKKVVVRKCVQVYDISFRLVVRERRLFSATFVMETLGIEIMLYSMFSTMFSIMLYIMLYSMLSIMLYIMQLHIILADVSPAPLLCKHSGQRLCSIVCSLQCFL